MTEFAEAKRWTNGYQHTFTGGPAINAPPWIHTAKAAVDYSRWDGRNRQLATDILDAAPWTNHPHEFVTNQVARDLQ